MGLAWLGTDLMGWRSLRFFTDIRKPLMATKIDDLTEMVIRLWLL